MDPVIASAVVAATSAVTVALLSMRTAGRVEETKRLAEENQGRVSDIETQRAGWQAINADLAADRERMKVERDEAIAHAERVEQERDAALADLAEERKIVEAYARKLGGTDGADR